MSGLGDLIKNAGFDVNEKVNEVFFHSLAEVPVAYEGFFRRKQWDRILSDVKYSSDEEEKALKELNDLIYSAVYDESRKVTMKDLREFYVVNAHNEKSEESKKCLDFIKRNLHIFRKDVPEATVINYRPYYLQFEASRSVLSSGQFGYGDFSYGIYPALRIDRNKPFCDALLDRLQRDIDEGRVPVLGFPVWSSVTVKAREKYYGYSIKQDKEVMEKLSDWLAQGYIIKDSNVYRLKYGTKFVDGKPTTDKWFYLKREESIE